MGGRWRICRNSLKCKDKMEYEPAWNDLVHCRVLEEALEGHQARCSHRMARQRTLAHANFLPRGSVRSLR